MLDFPNSPSLNENFLQWRWDGVKWTSIGLNLDAPVDGKTYGRKDGGWAEIVIDEATGDEIRAMVPDRFIGTTGLADALELVTVAGVTGTYTPDFHNFVNLRLNLTGNMTLAFPVTTLNDLQGRSGLIVTHHGVASTVSFSANYGRHRNTAPDLITTAGSHNIMNYSIWNPNRIAIGLIAGGIT